MATNTKNQRPDPAKEQQEALNRAVGASAIGKTAPALNRTSDASSLDTFNATPAPTKVESAVAGISRSREDDGLKNPGGASGDDNNMGGPRDLNADEAARAEEAARGRLDNVGNDHEDTDGEDDQSPFEFKNPAIEALKQEMYDSLETDDEQGQGAGTAAGKHAPGSSGGGGEVSSTGARGADGSGGQASATGSGATGGHEDAHDPFTGQGIGTNAYSGGGGLPGLPDINARVGGFQPDAQMTAVMGLAVAEASDHGDGRPSVADGGTSTPLANAYAYANSREGEKATAEKYGVTPSGGGAGEAEPEDSAEETSDEPEERGPLDALWEWISGERNWDGSMPTQTAGPSGDFTGVDLDGLDKVDKSDQVTQGKNVGVANLETSIGKALGTKGPKDQLPPGSDDSGGPPTPAEIAFRRHLYETLHYQGSPGHNEGVTNPDPTSEGIDRSGTVAIDHSRDVQESMVGQPVRDGSGASGRGPLTLGRLPGDLGNVDPGEGDDFGPITSNPQTDDPGSALDGFGGSGLSIADAHRDDEEDDDDSDDDDSN